MTVMLNEIHESPFLDRLHKKAQDVLAAHSREAHFQPGDFLCRYGGPADRTYLLRRGHVDLEINVPGRGPTKVGTVGPGEIIGWSWLLAPRRWHFDARATEATDAFVVNGAAVRNRCEADPELGYELVQDFLYVVQNRVEALREQLLDLQVRTD